MYELFPCNKYATIRRMLFTSRQTNGYYNCITRLTVRWKVKTGDCLLIDLGTELRMINARINYI